MRGTSERLAAAAAAAAAAKRTCLRADGTGAPGCTAGCGTDAAITRIDTPGPPPAAARSPAPPSTGSAAVADGGEATLYLSASAAEPLRKKITNNTKKPGH